MPNRSRKQSQDINETAFSIVQQITSEPVKKEKNPAAVALGRLGGLKGGIARKEALSSKRRSDIAKGAAKARWKKS